MKLNTSAKRTFAAVARTVGLITMDTTSAKAFNPVKGVPGFASNPSGKRG